MNESKTLILDIVKCVQKRTCIWDKKSKDYCKTYKLEEAWKEIANEIGYTENYCKKKWKNIRKGFLCSVKNETASSKRKHYLYNDMKFLFGQQSHDKKIEQINENIKQLCEHDIVRSDEDDRISIGDDINLVDMPPAFDEHNINNDINMESTGNLKDRKKSKKNFESILLKLLTKRRKRSLEEIAWLSFFKGLMPDILKLSSAKQRSLKKKFIKSVYNMYVDKLNIKI